MPPGKVAPGEAFTVVHSADLHLGSGMRMARKLGREDLQQASYEALHNLVTLAETADADILTLGGDLFDEPNLLNPVPRHRLARELERIPETHVAVVRGNHDHHAVNAPLVRWPDNVFEFDATNKTLDLGHVRIHGISYTSNREANSLLPRYPDARPDRFDIGLLHANVGGVTGHADYAPCTVNQLVEKGYRMWLLGHIHKRQVLSEDPLIVYPGNLQGRDIGETGMKTAERIEVSGAGTIEIQPCPIASIVWERIDVDATGAESVDEVIDRVESRLDAERTSSSGVRGLLTRVRVTGTTEVHAALAHVGPQESRADDIRKLVNDRFGERDPFVLVDRLEVATSTPLDLERLAASSDIAGLLVRLASDEETRRAILAELAADGPEDEATLEPIAAAAWSDALQDALVRMRGGT